MGDAISMSRNGQVTLHNELAKVPADRVVHLSGVSAEDIAAATSRFDDLPMAIVVAPPEARSVAGFVADVLDTLDAIARQLISEWLPEADELDGPQGAARAAIRAVATGRARAAGYSSVFLADLAERALTGRPPGTRLRPEVRTAGLTCVVAEGFRRERMVIAMATEDGAAGGPVVAGSEWLADHGRLGIWLIGDVPTNRDRVTTAHLVPAPRQPTAVVGRPHPGSAVEAMLEAVLARQEWASGRIWNGTYPSTLISTTIRPDLQWPDERVVVELDGREHCRPAMYDEDRVRDVQLQLDGYAVLRFTNARVRHDVQAVAAQIERIIRTRRHDMAKGQQGG